MFLLPFLGIAHSKTIAKHFTNGLQRHALAFREKEHHKYPASEADAGVEPKCTARCDTLHHGQEGRGDDNVGAPASNRVLFHC